MQYGIGQPVRRTEDPKFLTGRGQFLDDLKLVGMTHGAVVYSPHAHARIKHIDTAAAEAADGVLAVITGAELMEAGLGPMMPRYMPEDMGAPKGYRTKRFALATGKVLFVGDRVAFVIAETLDQARTAAELVHVEYEELSPVLTVGDAANGAAPLHEDSESNIIFTMQVGDSAATDAAFEQAAHVVSATLSHTRLTANAMETRGCIGEFEPSTGRYTLRTSTQVPMLMRSELCRMIFQIPEPFLRVIAPDVGGGFGTKSNGFPEDILVLYAAKKVGRPVKWTASRSEHMLSDDHAREQELDGELALDADGKFLGLRVRSRHDQGAYVVGSGANPPMHTMRLLTNAYDIPAADISFEGIVTNKPPLSLYRGAGRPEGIYAIEQLVDQASRELGIDRIELRRRNLIQPEELPYKTPNWFTYDSGEFEAVMDRAVEIAELDGFDARKAESKKQGLMRGLGVSYYIEDAGALNERMDLRFDATGCVTIVAGTSSHGQGHQTVYAQMVADWLSVPFEKIHFLQNDSDVVAVGRGTFASRSMVLGSGALRAAADDVIQKGKKIAAHLMEAAEGDIEFAEGAFTVSGTDKSMGISEVAMNTFKPMGIPPGIDLALSGTGSFGVTAPSFPNGCHICEVEIDPETGALGLDRYVVVDDIGVVINPLLAAGQIHGGVVQGVGKAICEGAVYDGSSGQLLNGTFLDYTMPRADDMPHMEVEFREVPCQTNPIGVKGAGEGGTVGATPAVIGAILDALSDYGVTEMPLPATPQRIWGAIHGADVS